MLKKTDILKHLVFYCFRCFLCFLKTDYDIKRSAYSYGSWKIRFYADIITTKQKYYE